VIEMHARGLSTRDVEVMLVEALGQRGRELIGRFKDNYTSAMKCLKGDLEECLTYLKFPEAHWRAIRTTKGSSPPKLPICESTAG